MPDPVPAANETTIAPNPISGVRSRRVPPRAVQIDGLVSQMKGIKMNTRAFITILISLMTNAVLFGIGAVTVLSIPSLNDRATVLLPVVIVVSIVLAPVIAWVIAPRLRARYWRPH